MRVIVTKRWIASALALFLCGCTEKPELSPSPSVHDDVLTEHRPVQAARPSAKLGEDCTQAGASGCLSGLCLHTQPELDKGYVCSQRCLSSAECPKDWSCGSLYPSAPERLCIPPAVKSQPSSP